MSSPAEVWIVTTTCPDQATADALAEALVAAGLAACAQAGAPVVSRYVWDGEMQRETEVPLTLKVAGHRLEECLARLRQDHPYAVPELLAWPCPVADPEYRDWVLGEEPA